MAHQNIPNIDPRSGFCSTNSIFYSKRDPVPLPPNSNLDITTFISSQPHFGTTAFIDASTGRSLSYSDLWRSVNGLSSFLSSVHGISKGNVVLILSPNSLYFPIVSLAVMSLGAILTTANTLNTPPEISAQIADSRPVLAFTTRSLLPKLAGHEFPILFLEEKTLLEWTDTDSHQRSPPREPVSQDDTAMILYSSGTTGKSKGVIFTHRNLISAIWIFHTNLKADGVKSKTFICTVPMFHIYGMAAFAIGNLTIGSTVVIISRFNMEEMLRAAADYGATHIGIVPPVLVAMVGSDKVLSLGTVKKVACGGATLGREMVDEFREKFPGVHILQGYGLTEATALGSSIVTEEESRRYGSVGLLVQNTEARIVDPVSGEFLPVNRKGELWLRGPYVTKGYLNNPEATKLTVDQEGWLKTGDLCYIDEDGYLFVIDRIKELIKYKAYQVAPAELEDLLLKHPEIIDAAVIPFPDKEVGQYPMGYVVRRKGSELSESMVIDFIRKQVASYKRIRRVAFVQEIPKNPSGKILRKDLIQHATCISLL
ncbi:4-coumarate--CoA ligase-like 4 [Phalaenopsis equestris]|uniref:4-coumarate--CoA ligase-like 4 n=1 Tax=Phalaenopsis equestris TaxID=78828 RepID=UPI0009E42161|nr:4-coumarate--CoA ligase-like 4 [Phalaenopsis equestris]